MRDARGSFPTVTITGNGFLTRAPSHNLAAFEHKPDGVGVVPCHATGPLVRQDCACDTFRTGKHPKATLNGSVTVRRTLAV